MRSALPRAAAQTIEACRAEKPDFIVCCVEEFSLILGWIASRFSRRSFWVVGQDPPFTGRYNGKSSIWLRLERALRRWLVSRLIAASSGVFCFIERRAIEEFVPARTRVIQLKTGVSDEAFEFMRSLRSTSLQRDSGSDYTIGYVGAVDAEQGILELLRAVSIARRSAPNIQVILIGQVDPHWSVEFDATLDRYSLRGVVEVTGWLSYPEMLRRLADCDVCCYVRRESMWAESAYPLKICEYLGSARPIVSWDYPGCRVMLGSGRYGQLVPPGDANQLAEELVGLSNSRVRQSIQAAILGDIEHLLARVNYWDLLDTCRQGL